MALTKAQTRKIEDTILVAKARQDELSEEIQRLEYELEALNLLYKKARSAECAACNMRNGVEKFDEKRLEF